jgi:hypothetical protein
VFKAVGCELYYNTAISFLKSWICARLCLYYPWEFIYTTNFAVYVLLNTRYQFKVKGKISRVSKYQVMKA